MDDYRQQTGQEPFTDAEWDDLKRRSDDFRERIKQPFVAPEEPGRNSACPCGSGDKYKRCCLSSTQGRG